MASDSAVKVLTFGDHTGMGDWVVLRMDFAGFESVEGMFLMSLSGCEALVKVGGLMYLGHGEKLTRFELRLKVSEPASIVSNGEALGVETINGDAIWFSSITVREAVLGGVGGRAEGISTMIKLKRR